MTTETAVHRAPRPDARRRPLAVALVGIAVFVLVVASGYSGLLVGPLGIGLFVLAWLLVPSSSRWSQRLAINGSVALAGIPVLWWFAWPVPGGLTHGVVAVALALAGSAATVTWRGGWRRLLPRPVAVDALILVAVAACAFLLLPLLSGSQRGASAAGILLQVTAGDNAAHFHMFETTRLLGVSGLAWGADSPHGGPFAFATYPQHFHTFSVFLSQFVGGPAIGGIEREAGLYLAGSTLTLLFAMATAVAALVSHRRLRDHPGVAVVVTAAAVSVLFYGFGATSIQYGFPPFQLAVLAAIVAIALVAGSGTMTIPVLAAVVSAALVVGFTWTLAVTLVIPALLGALLLLPRMRDRPLRERTGVVLCLAALVAGGLVEVAAAVASLSGIGAGGAIGLAGSVATAPIPDTGVVIVAAVVASAVWGRRNPSGLPGRPRWAAPIAVGGAGILGVVQFFVLAALSGGVADGISYYPTKFLDAVYLVMSPIAVLVVGSLLIALRTAVTRAVSVLIAFVATVAVLAYSGAPTDVIGPPAAGIRLRADLENASISLTPSSERILAGAREMQSAPCAQPVLLAPFTDDKPVLNGNQWALSLSGTWSDSDAPANAFLARLGGEGNTGLRPPTIVRHLLDGHPERCVLAVPTVIASLDAGTRRDFAPQLVAIAAR